MRRIAVSALALLLIAAAVPAPASAQDTFGPNRDIYLTAQAENPAHGGYLDLENNRIVTASDASDLSYIPGNGQGDYGQLVLSGGRGIYLVSSDYDGTQPDDTGVSYARTVPVQIGGAYFVRTRSGRLARLKPIALGQNGRVIHLEYSLVGDSSQSPPGDSGSLIVVFTPPAFVTVGNSFNLDLEAGTIAMDTAHTDVAVSLTGDADHLVRANATVQAVQAQGVIDEGIQGFDGLRSFPGTGFFSGENGRALDLYLVKTRSGKFAKFTIGQNTIVVPYGSHGGTTPQSHSFTAQLATQSGTPQLVQPDTGGLQSHTGITLVASQGLNVAGGTVVDRIAGDLYMAPGYVFASSTGTPNLLDLGSRTPDRVKAVPTSGYLPGPVQVVEGHTYAVKLNNGKYGLIYVSAKAEGGKAIVDAYYQPDGTTTFFDFNSVDTGTDLSSSSISLGNKGGSLSGSGSFGNYGGGTTVVGKGSDTSTNTTGSSGNTSQLPPPNQTSVGSGALPSDLHKGEVPTSDWVINAQVFSGKVYLNWDYPPGVDSATVGGFFVFQGSTPTDVSTMVNDLPLQALNYTVSPLPDGQTVYLRVQVFDKQQSLGKASVVLAVTPGDGGTATVVPGGPWGAASGSGGSGNGDGTASGSTGAGAGSGGAGSAAPAHRIRFQLGSGTMQVDGFAKGLDVPAQRIGNFSYVPFRALADALGAKVTYNADLRAVSFALGQSTVQLFLNSPQNAVVNNTFIHLDNGPVVVNGRTLVPVRFVSEQLGAKVTWNQADQSITIDSPQ